MSFLFLNQRQIYETESRIEISTINWGEGWLAGNSVKEFDHFA